MKNQFLFRLIAIFFLLSLTGCSDAKSPKMTNELHFSLAEISDLTISYDEEPITFFETDGDELVVKEYMTENKTSYYADVNESKDSIHISEGGKPLFKDGFSRYVEVYLPISYTKALTITTTDGNIDLSSINLQLSSK